MADLQQLEDSIVGLSLLDAAQLVKKLEARLGVSAAERTTIGSVAASATQRARSGSSTTAAAGRTSVTI
ncbi:MAG: hypothetical protein WB799_19810 [Candidatus Sulfotelmatobacter sp.]